MPRHRRLFRIFGSKIPSASGSFGTAARLGAAFSLPNERTSLCVSRRRCRLGTAFPDVGMLAATGGHALVCSHVAAMAHADCKRGGLLSHCRILYYERTLEPLRGDEAAADDGAMRRIHHLLHLFP